MEFTAPWVREEGWQRMWFKKSVCLGTSLKGKCCPVSGCSCYCWGSDSHSPLQGIFPTQGPNPGLLHCMLIFYHLSHQGSRWAGKNVKRERFPRGSRQEPLRRNGNPLQYPCLNRGAWWVTVHGVAKSQTQLSDSTITTRQEDRTRMGALRDTGHDRHPSFHPRLDDHST